MSMAAATTMSCRPRPCPPDQLTPDGVIFDRFGVRVPALIISPWVKPGSVLRPSGTTPFDHTSIIATLRKLHGFAPLTARDAAAPNLIDVLNGDGTNLGPASVQVQESVPSDEALAASVARPPNPLQHALNAAAIQLPAAGVDIAAHIQRIAAGPDPTPTPAPGVSAAEVIGAHIKAFLGLL